ncbi:MAG: hypothetical protein IH851_10960 [Armatimonadetes bacterium]|nr:hypothetical protein [Armatimonadota bacterium]
MFPGAVLMLPPPLWEQLAQDPPPVIQQQRVRFQLGDAVLEADEMTWVKKTGVRRFTGNVAVTYERTQLTADEAEVNDETQIAVFRKGVSITDEFIGTISADQVEIDFGESRGGLASGILIQAHEARFEGDLLEVEPGVWRLKGVRATTCSRDHPDYVVVLPDVVFKPGRYIAGRNAYLQLGRGFRIPVPFFHIGLNPDQTGLQPPAPSVNENFEVGYRWRNVFALGRQATFLYEQLADQNAVPYVNTQFAYSTRARPEEDLDRMITVRNEDRERFQNGFLDNIIVRSMGQEEWRLGRSSTVFFAGRSTNISTVARPGSPSRLDREWYGGVEVSGRLANLPAQLQLRYGSVRERESATRFTRTEAYGTLLVPHVALSDQFALRIRADVGSFFGDGSDYGWVRPQFGVVYRPDATVQLSAAYIASATWGTPSFDADRLFSMRAVHFRMDLALPATDLSILLKYDFDRGTWYDIEVSLGQVAHCIQPFIAYRKFPGSVSFGFQVRADNLFNALKRRNIGGER